MIGFGTVRTIASGVVVGGLAMYVLAQHHLVRTEEGVVAVPRQSVPFADSWADVRGWSAEEWQEHPELVQALVKDKRGSLVVRSAAEQAVQSAMLHEQQLNSRPLPTPSPAAAAEQQRMQRVENHTKNSIWTSFGNTRFSQNGR